MGQHITRELGDDVTMTSEDSDEVFEHDDNDTWETDIKQLMSEAAVFQQDRLLSGNETELTNEQLLQLVDKKDEALMLAAKIGHSLLTKITCLIARNKELEQQIDESADQISQLEFDKTQLNTQLKLTTSYCEDTDDEQDSLDGTTRRRRQSSCCSVSACCVDEVESLRSKLNEVETEKFELERRVEELETELRAETDRSKQQEIQRQVERTSTEREVRYFRDKLTNKRCTLQTTEEQLNRAKLEIVYLAGQLVQMEAEMEKLQARLENSQRDNSMLQCQYDDALHQREEYMALCNTLRETHGRRRQRRATVCGESSIAQELSTGFMSTQQQQQQQQQLSSTENLQRRLFETMKLLNMTVQCPTRSCPVSTSIECRVVSRCECHRPDTTTTISASADYWRDTCRVLGQPGRPGSSDLTNSLLRLQWLADKRRRLPSLLSTTDEQTVSTEEYCSECQSLADVTQTFDNVI